MDVSLSFWRMVFLRNCVFSWASSSIAFALFPVFAVSCSTRTWPACRVLTSKIDNLCLFLSEQLQDVSITTKVDWGGRWVNCVTLLYWMPDVTNFKWRRVVHEKQGLCNKCKKMPDVRPVWRCRWHRCLSPCMSCARLQSPSMPGALAKLHAFVSRLACIDDLPGLDLM